MSDDGSIWLKLAKTARRAGDYTMALKATAHAESLGAPYAYMEHAKWYYENHENAKAIRYLQSQDDLDAKASIKDTVIDILLLILITYRQLCYSSHIWKLPRTTKRRIFLLTERLLKWIQSKYSFNLA